MELGQAREVADISQAQVCCCCEPKWKRSQGGSDKIDDRDVGVDDTDDNTDAFPYGRDEIGSGGLRSQLGLLQIPSGFPNGPLGSDLPNAPWDSNASRV